MTRLLRVSVTLLAWFMVAAPSAEAQPLVPGAVVGAISRDGNVVTVRTEQAVVRLEFCTPAVVRVRARFAGSFRDAEHIMVVRHEWPAVPLRVQDLADRIHINTDRLSVRVHKSPFRLTWGHEEEAGQKYVVGLVQRFRDEDIPIDALHLDSTWRKFGTLGGRNATSFEWRQPGFPDPSAMFEALNGRHVGLVGLHVRARLDNGDSTKLLDEAKAAGVIADTPSKNIVNFFDPAATRWWWEHAVMPKVTQGATFLTTDEGSVYPGDTLHNLFPVVYAKAAYEGFQSALGRRGYNLTREGYAGVQRYPYIWAGDWPSRWTFFAPVIRGGLSLAVSGVSAWGHNAGGFEEVATEELYLRWTPFGFFNPVAHFLGMAHPQYKEPWRCGEKALATFRRYAHLRQRLLPYIYSAAYESYASGAPMMRPLVFDLPADRNVYDIDDQFFFGDALLVAPVTKAGATGRQVFLPPGEWFDYWTGARHAGNRTIEYAAPPDVMPVFVKAGAIIPMQPATANIGEKPLDPLTLDIYPSGRSSYTLYEDDGLTLDCQRGAFAKTNVTGSSPTSPSRPTGAGSSSARTCTAPRKCTRWSCGGRGGSRAAPAGSRTTPTRDRLHGCLPRSAPATHNPRNSLPPRRGSFRAGSTARCARSSRSAPRRSSS